MNIGKNRTKTDLMSTETQVESESTQLTFLSKLSELHNKSFYHQQQQNYEETIKYIKKSLRLVQKEKKLHEYIPSLILLKKYKIIRTLQLSAALSFVKNHSVALSSGKKALKSSFSIFEQILTLISKLKKTPKKGSENLQKLKKIIEKILSNNFDPPNFVLTQEWIFTYNMGNIMTIQEFQVSEWNNSLTMQKILSLSFTTQCIFLTIASFFTIATETRLSTPSIKDASKEWYSKSLEICKCFLPPSSALFQHIRKSYKKHCKPLKLEETKKSRIPSVRRFSAKRISEKPRGTSEKNMTKEIESPPRKLTPSTRTLQSKINLSRFKKSDRGPSPFGMVKPDGAQLRRDRLLKESLIPRKSLKVDSLESFDGKDYTAEEFKNNFVMTSKLLYGEDDEPCEENNKGDGMKKTKSFRRLVSKMDLKTNAI